MKIVTSLSGGMTSSYISANFYDDYRVFALVRIEDENSRFKDKRIIQEVEDRIQKPFIATAEDDIIIYTMLDLEQFLGKKIDWVSGITFDEAVRSKGGWLPNVLHRYCTTYLKMIPIFEWWANNFEEPVCMNIGFRQSEQERISRMMDSLDAEGFSSMRYSFEKHIGGSYDGKNKWENVRWRKPVFPLQSVSKDRIVEYWKDKPVRFAPLNNCVGCFHRSPILLKKMSIEHEQKFNWFASVEGGKNGFWRSDVSYAQIKNHKLQIEIDFEDFGECDSGGCELN